MTKLFVAAPITGLIDPTTNEIHEGFRKQHTELLTVLENAGYDLFSAHTREAWGKNMYLPDQAIREDLDHLESSDLMVARIGSPASLGVHLEIGFAIAHHKPILVITDEGALLPYLIRGLESVVPTDQITNASGPEFEQKLLKMIKDLLARKQTPSN